MIKVVGEKKTEIFKSNNFPMHFTPKTYSNVSCSLLSSGTYQEMHKYHRPTGNREMETQVPKKLLALNVDPDSWLPSICVLYPWEVPMGKIKQG